MTQAERLDFLVKAFQEENEDYQGLAWPKTQQEKEERLRSLMNVRVPKPLDEDVLAVQDAYLQACAKEKGIVPLSDLASVATQYPTSTHRHADKLILWQGDITRLECDAIVNAANAQMLGCFIPMHHCIDNCIHTFAGAQLRVDCHQRMSQLRKIHGGSYLQPTAVPMLTEAYNLPAKKIVHIVGPIVETVLNPTHEALLAACYQRILNLCAEEGLKSVAFCCISTGVFRFPNARAAEIATETVCAWLDAHPMKMEKVIFNVFKDEDKRHYEQCLQ